MGTSRHLGSFVLFREVWDGHTQIAAERDVAVYGWQSTWQVGLEWNPALS